MIKKSKGKPGAICHFPRLPTQTCCWLCFAACTPTYAGDPRLPPMCHLIPVHLAALCSLNHTL